MSTSSRRTIISKPESSENAAHGERPVRIGKRVLVVSTSFPSKVEPVHGVFVKERVRFVSQLPGVDVRVISPTPYFPPIKYFKRWYPWSQIPPKEEIDGIYVARPRYFFPPRIGGYVHAQLMFPAVARIVRKLARTFDFDIIDSHFVYPSGVLAAMLGRLFDKPVVMTGRGEDIERFPELPLIGVQIRRALRGATQLIAVSERIAERMEGLGGDPGKITVIPNGVDCDKFSPIPQGKAREALDLPVDRPIVLAVGYRLELKGFHILVDAIPRIREQLPNVLVVIVGGQARWASDFLPTIQRHIRTHGVENHVVLPGNRPQQELTAWYSAADLLAILSSREGSPNVLMEALACGLPAVATAVGGIPDVLSDRRLGVLLSDRSATTAADEIIRLIKEKKDRGAIRQAMRNRSWENTARQVNGVFDIAMKHACGVQK